MREIKFKCWIPSENFMGVPFNPFENSTDENPDGRWEDDSIFLQYTGLKDKNGKEIYEGDIINVVKSHEYDPFYGDYVVGFEKGCFSITRDDLAEYLWNYHMASEVVGNIYENPERIQKA